MLEASNRGALFDWMSIKETDWSNWPVVCQTDWEMAEPLMVAEQCSEKKPESRSHFELKFLALTMNGFGWLAGGIGNRFDGSATIERGISVFVMGTKKNTDWNRTLVG